MLQRLTIQNYALIEDLEIEFPKGLIILSGETGAGKSILLGALSLLLGEKADPGVLRIPDKNCVVEAEFDDGDLLRRVIAPSGRSRSFVNDEPVTLAVLSEVAQRRIDIHAQHQHLHLADPRFQLSVVDCFAACSGLLEAYQQDYKLLRDLQAMHQKLQQDLETTKREQDYREFQYQQLASAGLRAGELEQLEEEQRCLAHAEELLMALGQATAIFQQGGASLSQQLKTAVQQLEKSSRYLPTLQSVAERLQSCRIELDDLEGEMQQVASSVEVDPERLQQVDERLSSLYALLKRYQCSTIDELIQQRDSLDQSLAGISDAEERLHAMAAEISRKQSQLEEKAGALTQARCAVLSALSERIQTSVRDLEMPYACFEVAHTLLDHCGENGRDHFTFLFTANGDRPSDIAKVASGGELSRLMLVLKALMATYKTLPTLIFDEIDTGVSGRAADRMGELIGRMGKDMQLFAITHLPQIASKPASHYLVYKEFDENRQAHTRLRRLSDEERIEEIARMLSGATLTEASLANAKELIELNLKI